MVSAVFAYGTLKRGECREHCWPHAPLEIQPAFVRGHLIDVGPFPGWLAGAGWVRGQLWRFAPEAIPDVLSALDRIEGYQQAGEADEYVRIVVEAFDAPGGTALSQAYIYQLVDARLIARGRSLPLRLDAAGTAYAEWPAQET